MGPGGIRGVMLISYVACAVGLLAGSLGARGSLLTFLFILIGVIALFVTWGMGLYLSARARRWGWFVGDLLFPSLWLLFHALSGPVEAAVSMAPAWAVKAGEYEVYRSPLKGSRTCIVTNQRIVVLGKDTIEQVQFIDIDSVRVDYGRVSVGTKTTKMYYGVQPVSGISLETPTVRQAADLAKAIQQMM